MKRINVSQTLWELLAGIAGYGVVCQIAGVFFTADRIQYSVGLWIGIVLAMAMAVHMYWSIERAFSQGESSAQKVVRSHGLIRYAAVVVVFFLLAVTKAANPLAAFLGVMGLKAAAYLQPFTHKLFLKIQAALH